MKSSKILKKIAAAGLLASMAMPVMAGSPVVELNLKNGAIVNEDLPQLRRAHKNATFTLKGADRETIDACIDQLFDYYEEDITFCVDYNEGTINVRKQFQED